MDEAVHPSWHSFLMPVVLWMPEQPVLPELGIVGFPYKEVGLFGRNGRPVVNGQLYATPCIPAHYGRIAMAI